MLGYNLYRIDKMKNKIKTFKPWSIVFLLGLLFDININYAACSDCCAQMGGIQYCDSSTGRFVCANGYYSSCYCTRHAVMDLQRVEGCCLWQGGVMLVNPTGLVICNNGGVSAICSLTQPTTSSSW